VRPLELAETHSHNKLRTLFSSTNPFLSINPFCQFMNRKVHKSCPVILYLLGQNSACHQNAAWWASCILPLIRPVFQGSYNAVYNTKIQYNTHYCIIRRTSLVVAGSLGRHLLPCCVASTKLQQWNGDDPKVLLQWPNESLESNRRNILTIRVFYPPRLMFRWPLFCTYSQIDGALKNRKVIHLSSDSCYHDWDTYYRS